VTQATLLSGGGSIAPGVGLDVVDPLAKFNECSFIHSRNIDGVQNFKKGHVTQTTPLSRKIFHPCGGTYPAILDSFVKFEERSFIHSRNIE